MGEARSVNPWERALIRRLEEQVEAHRNGSAGAPQAVARYLRLVADKVDPACHQDFFLPEELAEPDASPLDRLKRTVGEVLDRREEIFGEGSEPDELLRDAEELLHSLHSE